MDALGYQVGGETRYIHSCGHDAHSTMVLAASEIIAKEYPELKGWFKAIFQPAEEIGMGAKAMIKDGVLEGVDTIIGIHLRPIQETPFGMAAASLSHSESISFSYKIKGKAAHTGRPHLGTNTANVTAAIVQGINSIKLNPLKCGTINVVRIEAGEASSNVIPEKGVITINIRAEDNQFGEFIFNKVDKKVNYIAKSMDATAELLRKKEIPACLSNEKAIDLCRAAIIKVLGEDGLIDNLLSPGGEDFWYYPRSKKDLKASYIGLGADFSPGLHDPQASFNLDTLIIGTLILIEVVLEFINRG